MIEILNQLKLKGKLNMAKNVYKVIRFKTLYETDMKKMENSLNKYAEKGWELKDAILTDADDNYLITCILKGKA